MVSIALLGRLKPRRSWRCRANRTSRGRRPIPCVLPVDHTTRRHRLVDYTTLLHAGPPRRCEPDRPFGCTSPARRDVSISAPYTRAGAGRLRADRGGQRNYSPLSFGPVSLLGSASSASTAASRRSTSRRSRTLAGDVDQGRDPAAFLADSPDTMALSVVTRTSVSDFAEPSIVTGNLTRASGRRFHL